MAFPALRSVFFFLWRLLRIGLVFFLRSVVGPENSRDSLNQSANQNEIATCLVENCSNMALYVNFTNSFAFLKWKKTLQNCLDCLLFILFPAENIKRRRIEGHTVRWPWMEKIIPGEVVAQNTESETHLFARQRQYGFSSTLEKNHCCWLASLVITALVGFGL